MDHGDDAQWGIPWHGQFPGSNVLSQMAGKLSYANQGPIISRTMFPAQLGAGVGSLVGSVALGAGSQVPPRNVAIRTRPLAWGKGMTAVTSPLQPSRAHAPLTMGGQPDLKFCRTFKLSDAKRAKTRQEKIAGKEEKRASRPVRA